MTEEDQLPEGLVEPTVLGAMRRHQLLVVVTMLASVTLALAYGLLSPKEYRATATVSAPRPVGSTAQTDAQYLDSQVLLLNSPEVGDRAFRLVEEAATSTNIKRENLTPASGEAEITPPVGDSTGSYGTTLVTIAFTASSAADAQVGANALAAAYDKVRSAEIAAQADARLARLDEAISKTTFQDGLPALRAERAQAVIDRSADLAQRASIGPAGTPQAPVNPGLASVLALGLCFGLVAGGAGAFTRASRLKLVGDARVAQRVYSAPLLCERQDRSAGHPAQLTEPNRLFARAVTHRLKTLDAPAVLAVVAAPGHSARSTTAADLALALAEGELPVLAIDGDAGMMASKLCPGSPMTRAQRAAQPFVASPLHTNLAVSDLSGVAWSSEVQHLIGTQDHLLVVDCPPPAQSARAVDLLSHCDTAVVLVRADEPVRAHVEMARWLEVTGTVVLGYVFTPHARRTPWARMSWPVGAKTSRGRSHVRVRTAGGSLPHFLEESLARPGEDSSGPLAPQRRAPRSTAS